MLCTHNFCTFTWTVYWKSIHPSGGWDLTTEPKVYKLVIHSCIWIHICPTYSNGCLQKFTCVNLTTGIMIWPLIWRVHKHFLNVSLILQSTEQQDILGHTIWTLQKQYQWACLAVCHDCCFPRARKLKTRWLLCPNDLERLNGWQVIPADPN